LEAVRLDGEPITMHAAATEKSEAEFIVKTLEKLLGGHTFFSIDSGRSTGAEDTDYSFSDTAILYRTEAQAQALTEALDRSGIPYQSRSHGQLADHTEVASWIEALQQRAEGSERTAWEQLEALAQETQGGERLLELLKPLVSPTETDIDALIDALILCTDMEQWDPRAERVSLLTLHASKGLEFRVVFLVGCEDGLLPLRWGGDEEVDTAEERRLFYVGMTRAKERLYLLRANSRQRNGQVQELLPSPFLKEIPSRLVHHAAAYVPKTKKAEPDAKADQLSLW
ncbi:MAG: 3'-5' exonuclease, partial [Myxococcota bacterium]